MKIRIQFLLMCICSIPLLAQTKTCPCCIKGEVLDNNSKEPIPFATVSIKGSEKYTQTDINGNFVIEGICTDSCTLIISCLGYSSVTNEHAHEKNDKHPHFYLTQKITGLGEITIQAEKRKERGTETISQTTLSKEEIKSIPSQSLAASLSSIEGVTFSSAGTNVQLPVIQGLSGNRILVLNNGLKHAFQNWGNEHAPEIDINAANKITVIKGASGVRFGPEALSGVVIVEPNPLLLDNPLYATIGSSFQTNGRGINTTLEIGKGSEKWSYFLNGSHTRIGDRSAPDYNLTNTGKSETAFSLGVLHHIDNFDFKVYYSSINQNLGLLRSSVSNSASSFINSINSDRPIFVNSFSYDINQPNQVTQHQLAKAEVDWYYSDEGKFNFKAGIQLNERDEFDVRRNEELPIIDLDLVTYDYQLEWEHPEWSGLDGVVGVQYFSQNNDNNPGTQTTPFIPNYNTDRYSLYVIEKKKFGQNALEAGVRFDIETNDVRGRETSQDIFRDNYSFNNFTASLGYSWKTSDNSRFKTNIGSAFRVPNVAELFSFGQQGFKSTFGLLRFTNNDGVLSTRDVISLDKSDVVLEKGYKLTNEYRVNTKSNSHVVSSYAHYIDNFVFERPIGVFGTIRGPQPGFIIDQTDALFLGVDYTWKEEISKQISSTFGLSYLWSKNINKNESLINQPPIATNLQLQWDQGQYGIFDSSKWSIKPSYTFRQFQAPRTVTPENIIDGSIEITPDSEIFDFINAPDGYFLLDVAWNFKLKKINGNVTAQNILNTSYRNYLNELRYFADEPGINLLLTVNYKF